VYQPRGGRQEVSHKAAEQRRQTVKFQLRGVRTAVARDGTERICR